MIARNGIGPRKERVGELNLTRRRRMPPWLSLICRLTLALALMGVALAVNWASRADLRDTADGTVSFTDVLYFTVITITSVGYGDIVPISERARLLDTLLVTPIRLFVWLIFLGTAYDFALRRIGERWRMRAIQHSLSGHTVVIGYGTSGAEAVKELIRRGTNPASIVVIDPHEAPLDAARACGVTVLHADAARNVALEAVHIARARNVMISAGRDDTSILIVLTARRLTPSVPISVVIRSEDNESIARQAGANTVINPASFAGLLMAGAAHGPHTADYLTDLAAVDGRVSLNERPAKPDEIGKPLATIRTGLGVRIYRGEECFGFWQQGARHIEAGDLIVEIVPDENREPAND